MLEFPLRCVMMALLASVSAAAEMHPWAMALIPAPVALSWARGNPARSAALGISAVLGAVPGAWMAGAPWLGWAAGAGLLAYGLSVGVGILLGMSLRRWTFGTCVAVVTAAVFAISAAYVASNWRELREAMTIFVNDHIAGLEQAVQPGAERPEAAIAGLRAVDAHWPYLSLGFLFGEMLLWTTLVVGVCGAALRRRPVETPGAAWANPQLGRFRDMRPPDALVWLAIVLAVMVFLDRRWPVDALRLAAWNGAVGLTFVYLVNGLGILVYAIGALRWSPALSYVVILVLFGLWSFPILGVIGFFDTWWELRRRLDRLAEIRRLRGQPGGDE